jgi:hypothetical protein
MKQTAVEWLIYQVNTAKWKFADKTDREAIIQQAKEMEKEQMEKTWVAGLYCETGDRQAFIDYYNETFKSE